MNPMTSMQRAFPKSAATVAAHQRKAFTVVELLAIVSVVLLLASLSLATLARTTHHTTRAACAANLRQVTMAFHIYGTENNQQLPAAAGYWAWDIPWDLAAALGRYGAPRNSLYCPANPDRNADALWNYAPNRYRIIGYALTLANGGSISVTNWNSTLTPQPLAFGPIMMPPPLASKRVLMADATLSQIGQNNEAYRDGYDYVHLQGSYASQRASSHLDRLLPAGGNLGMLDGHVEWRTFQNMHVRTAVGSLTPVFWW